MNEIKIYEKRGTMSEYVYVFQHKDYPFLYVGRTSNIKKRIKEHLYSDSDNIGRKYTDLLLESSVYYYTMKNKAESISVEAFLINKYKPKLNKSLVYDSKSEPSNMEIILPYPIVLDLNQITNTKDFYKQKEITHNTLKKLNELIEENAKYEAQIFEISKKNSKLLDVQNTLMINNDADPILVDFDEVEYILKNISKTYELEFYGCLYDTNGKVEYVSKITGNSNRISYYG